MARWRIEARGVAAALVASLIGAGFSAHALGPAPAVARADAPRTGYEADDHFPGAAYFTAVDDNAAAARGSTGTATLPDLPVPHDLASDGTVHPAHPFVFRGSAADRDRALQCLTSAIYYEAATEPDDGQRAVAQVILNRVRHPAFPATVCGVVYQGSERRGCQFSFACDGAMARAPARAAWLRAWRVADAALAGSVFAPVGLATHYHTYAVTPAWNRSLVMTGVFGAHFFHRWQGWWGTPAAFSQPYRGAEPAPGPHAAPESPALIVAAAQAASVAPWSAPTSPHPAAALAASPSPVPAPARDAVQPGYGESGQIQPAYAAPVTPDSQILDRWKDSGKPIR